MAESSADTPVHTRIYVGSISQHLADSIDDLSSRFSKYGSLVKDIELHKKPTLDTHFGYITLDISPKKFAELKKAFNKVKFKGSVLSIDAAKPDFQERWAVDKARKNPPLTKTEALRKYGKKRREIDVIPGRLRTTRRKKYRYMTFRVFIGEKKIVVKSHKKKLWGIVKDKKFDEMIWRFSNRKWLDGNGDVIETVDFQPIQTKTGVSLIKNDDNDEHAVVKKSAEEEEEEEAERQRNFDILEKMFGNASKDYMPKASIDTRADDDVEMKPVSEAEDSSSDDSDKDSDSDSESDSDDEEEEEEEEKSEWENHKNFQKVEKIEEPKPKQSSANTKPATKDEDKVEEKSTHKVVNSTSTFRNLFNPAEDTGSFSLFAANSGDIDDDMDDTVLKEIDEAEAAAAKSQANKKDTDPFSLLSFPAVNKVRKGLFFGHFESPFLSAQSQAALLPTLAFENEKWQEQFYDKKSEWSKKFRARRKEALRQIEKKNKARRRNNVL